MKVSVCFLTWNCLNVIRDSFEHVYNEVDSLGGEIVIVDNGSDDGTIQFFNKQYANGKSFKYFRFKENMGISKGKNKCIEMAEGEYILLVDGDIDPVHNSIIMLCKYLDDNPKCETIGFHPGQWSRDRNNFGQHNYEETCHTLFNPQPLNRACIYYGLYRREVFDRGLRMNEEGEFGKAGYGWEDFDFYERMCAMEIVQYAAGVNHDNGKYFHNINSSIRAMGRQKYIETSQQRHEEFHKIWKKKSIATLTP